MSDFQYLTNSTNFHLNLSSNICIVRYGEIFRGDKVRHWGHYGVGELDKDHYVEVYIGVTMGRSSGETRDTVG